MSPALEITVQDVAGVRTALREGAHRVELCTALGVAGLTPSIGVTEAAVEAARAAGAGGFVDVLVRPREGDFVYDRAELDVAIRDIRRAAAAGVAGVVIGAVTADGQIDRAAVRELRSAAEGVNVTFHRAFDVLADRHRGLEDLIDLGFRRVLTSGGAPTCAQGLPALADLAERAAGRIEIMAGGGVRVADIPALLAAGVHAVHLSARRTVVGGPSRPGESASYFRTDPELVRAAASAMGR